MAQNQHQSVIAEGTGEHHRTGARGQDRVRQGGDQRDPLAAPTSGLGLPERHRQRRRHRQQRKAHPRAEGGRGRRQRQQSQRGRLCRLRAQPLRHHERKGCERRRGGWSGRRGCEHGGSAGADREQLRAALGEGVDGGAQGEQGLLAAPQALGAGGLDAGELRPAHPHHLAQERGACGKLPERAQPVLALAAPRFALLDQARQRRPAAAQLRRLFLRERLEGEAALEADVEGRAGVRAQGGMRALRASRERVEAEFQGGDPAAELDRLPALAGELRALRANHHQGPLEAGAFGPKMVLGRGRGGR